MHIGDFGKIQQEVEAATGDASTSVEPDTFNWFDTQIRLRTNISPYTLIKISLIANGEIQVTEAQALGVMLRTLRAWIEPADWPVFEDLAEQNEADVDLLGQVVTALYPGLAGRPTQRSSDSADGRSAETSTPPSNVKSSRSSRGSRSPGSTAKPRKAAAKKAAAATG
jgi:hypothetical protein